MAVLHLYHTLRLLGLIGIAAVASGCAVGQLLDEYSDARIDYLRDAPFYKSYRDAGATAGNAVCAAIAVDPVTQREFPDAVAALQPLVAALNARLDGRCERLAEDPLLLTGVPEVWAGSTAATIAPDVLRGVVDDHGPQMALVVRKSSDAWRTAVAANMQPLDAGRVLWIRVGLSEYPQTTKGLAKRVVLGTDHQQEIPLVSHFKDSVAVVHLTGLAIDREGAIVRAGVEGIVSKPPGFCWECTALSLADFDTGKLAGVANMTDAELQKASDAKRTRAPGASPSWQVALDELVQQLSAS